MSRRSRSKGLGISRGERYALLPEEVIESIAYAGLPDYSKAVLVALCARFTGHNNGNLSLPFSAAKTLGVGHQWKLYAGLKILVLADLVQRTRIGHLSNGTKVCSLYALTWRGIDAAPEGVSYDFGIGQCPIPSHAWVRWQKPADWLSRIRTIARENHGRQSETKNPVSTTVGKGRSTTVGEGKAFYRSTRG